MAATTWVTTPLAKSDLRADARKAREILAVLRNLGEDDVNIIMGDMKREIVWQIGMLAGGECAHSHDYQIRMIRRAAWKVIDHRNPSVRQ